MVPLEDAHSGCLTLSASLYSPSGSSLCVCRTDALFHRAGNYGQEIQRLFQDKSANKWQVNRNPVPVISCVAEMLYNPALTQSCQHTQPPNALVPPYIQLNKLWGVQSVFLKFEPLTFSMWIFFFKKNNFLFINILILFTHHLPPTTPLSPTFFIVL